MKKFVLPALLALVIGAVMIITMSVKSSVALPEAFRDPGVTWSSSSGEFCINEDGSINGFVVDENGEEVPFDLLWNEQYGTAFPAGETDGAPLFTTGLRLWGSQLTFLIEEDNVGLGSKKLIFQRVS